MKTQLPAHALRPVSEDLLKSTSEVSPTQEARRTQEWRSAPLDKGLEAYVSSAAGLVRGLLTQRALDLNDSSAFVLQIRTLRPEKVMCPVHMFRTSWWLALGVCGPFPKFKASLWADQFF